MVLKFITYGWCFQIDFMNGNEAFLKEVKRLITLRISGVRSKQSLRFDTKDNDTDFTFLNLGKQHAADKNRSQYRILVFLASFE